MARIPVNGSSNSSGKFLKWGEVTEGTELEGTFLGLHDGRYGPLLELETHEGCLTLPAPVALQRQLERVRVGAELAIVYGGMQHNAKTNRDYHAFTVFVTDPTDLRPAAPRSRATTSTGDAVPF
jgi:hypothetical protein